MDYYIYSDEMDPVSFEEILVFKKDNWYDYDLSEDGKIKIYGAENEPYKHFSLQKGTKLIGKPHGISSNIKWFKQRFITEEEWREKQINKLI